jgi:dCMP deaminase
MMIGISGTNGAGKTTTAEYLKKKGYAYYSCSDILRDILREKGEEITRDNLRELGNKIRKEYGNSELAKRLFKKIGNTEQSENVIIDSLRHTDEINVFRNFGDKFKLIFIDAPVEIRYERVRERKRADDFVSFDKFKSDEEKEMNTEGAGQQLGLCKEAADVLIINEGTMNELQKIIDRETQKKNDTPEQKVVINRPTKDEYYMNIAKQIAMRSNCLSAIHGALIVKDDQIVATGYNGAPRKTKDCMERGSCLRRELNIESGTRYEMCRTVHAEQNAIINAARAGVSLLGGTMYLYSMKIFSETEPVQIDAGPCFICKKMIINAGIKYMVCALKDRTIIRYSIDKWTKDWQENDMIDDLNKYNAEYKKKC